MTATLAVGVAAVASLGLFYGDEPVLAWFPGESRLGGALLRGEAASGGVRLISIHASNAVVLQGDDYLFPLKLLLQGGIPLPAPNGAVCRPGQA